MEIVISLGVGGCEEHASDSNTRWQCSSSRNAAGNLHLILAVAPEHQPIAFTIQYCLNGMTRMDIRKKRNMSFANSRRRIPSNSKNLSPGLNKNSRTKRTVRKFGPTTSCGQSQLLQSISDLLNCVHHQFQIINYCLKKVAISVNKLLFFSFAPLKLVRCSNFTGACIVDCDFYTFEHLCPELLYHRWKFIRKSF